MQSPDKIDKNKLFENIVKKLNPSQQLLEDGHNVNNQANNRQKVSNDSVKIAPL